VTVTRNKRMIDDPQFGEAQEHLLRIQARMADEAIERQRAINEKVAGNEKLADIGLKILDATLTVQKDHNPGSAVVLRHIVRGVEAACEALGFDLGKGVIPGVLPIRGLGAVSTDFYGTGIAIVGIDAAIIPFTGMLTDLFSETFIYEETKDGLSIVPDPARTVDRLIGGKTVLENIRDGMEGRDSLIHYWERFLLHFAGLSFAWPDPKLTPDQKAMKFQLSSAMEVFVVGHEYGHHIRRHSAGADAASSLPTEAAHRLELEADMTAWRIAQYLGSIGFAGKFTNKRNLWMESSAGAAAYLVTADMVRCVRDILETGTATEQISATHPSIRERLRALQHWDGFEESMQGEFRVRRWFICKVAQDIYEYLIPKFLAAHKAGFRPTHL
jgi:hypothetical protein